MGARFLSSTGLGSGNLIERAQFFPVPALDKNRSPINRAKKFYVFASKRRKYKLFPLVKRRVVPGLSRLSKSLCVQSLCAFFLP